MFIEAALGIHWLVLLHFAGNAFLRSYQLLVSPSIVTYLIREQFFGFKNSPLTDKKGFLHKIKLSLFALCFKEWYMDDLIHQLFWNIMKVSGKKFKFITPLPAVVLVASALIMAIMMLVFHRHFEPSILYIISIAMATTGLVFALRSFVEKREVYLILGLSGGMHAMIAFAVVLTDKADWTHVAYYLGGIVISLIVGALSLRRLTDFGVRLNIRWYQGHCYEHPKMNITFLVSCLGLMGFPVTSAFLGIELIYGYIRPDQVLLITIISISLWINSLSLIRIYARIFLGPHIRTYHETARKSA
jgi:hypothetical protein